MSAQTMFREDELVTRRMNGQTSVFPVVGGRLRLAHEENDNLSLATEMVSWDGQYAVFRCSAETQKGRFVGYGTANAQRDTRLAESLIELAENSVDCKSLAVCWLRSRVHGTGRGPACPQSGHRRGAN